VKEQSHKTEMSAALRGDFKRLRERGVSTTLSPGETETLESGLDVVEAVPVSSESGDVEAIVPAGPNPSAEAEVGVETEPEPEPESPPGWLDRLLGR
jgi:hypothetical protein